MQRQPITRLDTSHTWEDLAAFVRAVQVPLNALMKFSDSGRARIHYITREGAIVVQAICTLSRGWRYGLPHGTPSGLEAATAAGASWQKNSGA